MISYLFKGLEHLVILVSAEGSGIDFLPAQRDKYVHTHPYKYMYVFTQTHKEAKAQRWQKWHFILVLGTQCKALLGRLPIEKLFFSIW
jgi:hypothetical protein